MKTTAIICEYNPFHKGHSLQINLIKEQGSAVVCIMSGNFVQRGQPAVFGKFDRAKAAILEGADLVVELPYPYCCSAAEHFCFGGVALANSLGVVDELCFGSECGNIDKLKEASDRLRSTEFTEAVKTARADRQNKEKPYANLRSMIYEKLYGEKLSDMPNDILAVEYITALKKIKSNILPITYQRKEGFSATESRKLLSEKNDLSMIPEKARGVFENAVRYDIKNLEKEIRFFYTFADTKQLSLCYGMTNGIAERIKKAANESMGLDDLIDRIKGKSYTNAKIRRCIINGMLGAHTEDLKMPPMYTQVLACNDVGRKLVKQIQKCGNIEIITKPSHYKNLDGLAKKQAELSFAADKLQTLAADTKQPSNYFVKQTPYIQK